MCVAFDQHYTRQFPVLQFWQTEVLWFRLPTKPSFGTTKTCFCMVPFTCAFLAYSLDPPFFFYQNRQTIDSLLNFSCRWKFWQVNAYYLESVTYLSVICNQFWGHTLSKGCSQNGPIEDVEEKASDQ